MLPVPNRERGVAARRVAEGPIEASFRLLKKALRCPEQRLCIRPSVKSRRIVPGKETCLELANPVPARCERRPCVIRETALDLGFIELCSVEAAEGRR